MKGFFVIALVVFFSIWSCDSFSPPTKQEMDEMFKVIKHTYYNITDGEAQRLLDVWIYNIMNNQLLELNETSLEDKYEKRFLACPPVSIPPIPNDARQLHPGHIGIIGTMGDSITAGFGARDTSVFSLKEYREISWNIGAKSNTLFTLLKQYNPSIIGASNFIGSDLENVNNGNNGAVSGAVVEDMPSQANWLVNKISKINNANNLWKLVTIWIGGNNLCKFSTCTDPNTMTSAANFKANLQNAINILSGMPKTLVNLVAGLDITELSKYATVTCKIVHNVACPCGTSSNENVLNSIRARRLEYNSAMNTLVQELNNQYFKTRQDFGIAYQLFLTDTRIPDKSYLSTGDCFHPAEKTHGFLATALWNNLITPTPQKKRYWRPEDNEQPICASSDTLLVVDLF